MAELTFTADAVGALFLKRQHLDQPQALPFTPERAIEFVADAGGLQLDSINVVERAHYLTLWSRFGPYRKEDFDHLAYERKGLVEYWAHAACLVAASDLPGWGRAMADYRRRHTGWSDWLKANPRILRRVEGEIERRGPLSSADFERPAAQGKSTGWWDWKPAHHALHFLWMSGRLGVHSRRHFQKRYDLASRVLPAVTPIKATEFPLWHLRKSLRAMGAATSADLDRYLTFPRVKSVDRRHALASLVKSGEAVEVHVSDRMGRWYALAEDIAELKMVAPSRGTTLLSPFDSVLWHRARAKTLFGLDYKIEVYTPAAKRVFGYYTMPILHDGRMIGRLDPKNHRAERRLEIRAAHFHSTPDDAALRGTARAVRSLATFLGADDVSAPSGPLREALAVA